jgi:hypothetical protein
MQEARRHRELAAQPTAQLSFSRGTTIATNFRGWSHVTSWRPVHDLRVAVMLVDGHLTQMPTVGRRAFVVEHLGIAMDETAAELVRPCSGTGSTPIGVTGTT